VTRSIPRLDPIVQAFDDLPPMGNRTPEDFSAALDISQPYPTLEAGWTVDCSRYGRVLQFPDGSYFFLDEETK
jgi:hypothetical protein